jgi:hypothetical protein
VLVIHPKHPEWTSLNFELLAGTRPIALVVNLSQHTQSRPWWNARHKPLGHAFAFFIGQQMPAIAGHSYCSSLCVIFEVEEDSFLVASTI